MFEKSFENNQPEPLQGAGRAAARTKVRGRMKAQVCLGVQLLLSRTARCRGGTATPATGLAMKRKSKLSVKTTEWSEQLQVRGEVRVRDSLRLVSSCFFLLLLFLSFYFCYFPSSSSSRYFFFYFPPQRVKVLPLRRRFREKRKYIDSEKRKKRKRESFVQIYFSKRIVFFEKRYLFFLVCVIYTIPA